MCVCEPDGVSEQSEDESDRRVKGAGAPTGEATVKTVISLPAHVILLVQHIIGGDALCVCVCVCLIIKDWYRHMEGLHLRQETPSNNA